jgi:hypothetical protein
MEWLALLLVQIGIERALLHAMHLTGIKMMELKIS